MTSHSLFSHSVAHGTATGSGGVPFVAGITGEVRSGGCWLEGYWWYAGASTSAQWFTFWLITNGTGGAGKTAVRVTAADTLSGTLTANSWNWIPVASPLPLPIGSAFVVQTGLTLTGGAFANAPGIFSGTGVHPNGIVSGPLFAFADATSEGNNANTNPWGGWGQAVFSTAGADPRTTLATGSSSSGSFGMDVQIADADPTGGYTGPFMPWPMPPGATAGPNADVDLDEQYVIATEEWLDRDCLADGTWFYSPAGAGALPDKMDVWRISDKSNVLTATPAWSRATGTGWVFAAFPGGSTLGPDKYKVSVYNSAATGTGPGWSVKTVGYFGAGGPGENGITWGPVHVPGLSEASDAAIFGGGGREPGQGTFANPTTGPDQYPDTYADGESQCYWVGLQVTPTPVTGTGRAAVLLAASATGSPARHGSGSVPVALAATGAGSATRAGSAAVAISLLASAAGLPQRLGTGAAAVSLAVTATAPAGPLQWPDAELAMCELLEELGTTGTETLPDLATTLPYIRITRTGGTDDGVTDVSTVSVDVFAASATQAKSLADKCRSLLVGSGLGTPPARQTGNGTVDRVTTISGPVRLPPTNSGSLRMVVASYRVSMRRQAQ